MNEYKTLLDPAGMHYMKTVREIPLAEPLDTPEKVVSFFREQFQMDELAEEYVYILAVNQASKGLGVFELTHGTSKTTLISARDIFVKLCLAGATSFILVHNHPGGSTFPSRQDMETTMLLAHAGQLMDIDLIDHLIIGHEGDYLSMREQGLLSSDSKRKEVAASTTPRIAYAMRGACGI